MRGFDGALWVRYLDPDHGAAMVQGGAEGGNTTSAIYATNDGGRTWLPVSFAGQ